MKTLVRCASLASVLAVVLLLYDGGQASDPLAVAVANAAVRCPEGFTVKVHGLPPESEPTSSLSERCVLDLGIPAGATGAPGAAGPAGAPGAAGAPGTNGVSGYAPVSKTFTFGSKSYRWAGTAKCPAGKKAIGGGASVTTVATGKNNSDNRWAITTSQPTPDGQGWTAVTTINTSKSNTFKVLPPPPGSLKVIAICIRLGPLVSRH